MLGHAIRSVNAQCQVVLFKWKNPIDESKVQSWAELASSEPLDVSSELVGSVTFDKDMSGASGSFSFSLPATQDWKTQIRPGMWCLIYFSNSGDLALPSSSNGKGSTKVRMEDLYKQRNRLRCIGFIDRITFNSEVESVGASEMSFEISGKDFGYIFESTECWHNFFYFESGMIDAATTSLKTRTAQTVDSLLEIIHGLFFSPQDFAQSLNQDPGNLSRPPTISQVGYQFLLPREMAIEALGLSLRPKHSAPFWGSLENTLDFSPSKATLPVENPLSALNGNSWQKLKAFSLEPLHELFTEVDEDGVPKLVFRPIPWKSDPTGYPRLGPFIQSLADLWEQGNNLTINAIDVFRISIGQDAHSAYNHFLLTAHQADMSASDNISELLNPSPQSGRRYPYLVLASVARIGLKLMHVEIDSLIQLGLNADGKVDQGILLEFNELLYNYWHNADRFENGTVDIVGNSKIKCGRVLQFGPDVSYLAGKLFYIEGYTDHFTIEANGVGQWEQTLKLTRGLPLSAYRNSLGLNPTNAATATEKDNFKEAASFTPRRPR